MNKLEERLWKYIPQDLLACECWPWLGKGRHSYGYGLFEMKMPHRKYGFGAVQAHRAVWLVLRGDPGKLSVLHGCDNAICVNPFHLRLGTHKDNMQDASERKRLYHLRQTHCKNGHEWTEENTCVLSNGWKRCRTCRRISMGYAK